MADAELAFINGETPYVKCQPSCEARSLRSTGGVVHLDQVPHSSAAPHNDQLSPRQHPTTTSKGCQGLGHGKIAQEPLKPLSRLENLQAGPGETCSVAIDQPSVEPLGTTLQSEEDESRYPKGIKLAVVALALALALLLFGLVGLPSDLIQPS